MPATPQNAAASDPLLGQLIGGRYRVLGIVGTGGMGVVYDGLHEELERPVALKVLSAAWASDEEAIQRFQREARTSSNIGHPHIVDVYDLGRLEDGRPYLAMERLRGMSLADLLEDQAGLPPERVALWIRQVASALDAVHARGIIHRDIKPENLILEHGDTGADAIKLLDFGLAAFAIPSEEHQRLTRAGQIHGTPHYMAPESGSDTQPDRRADVYSLAVVAYELLCGVLPFDSPNPLHILTEKMRRDAPSMSERTGLPYPDELEQVLGRGLAREREDRYATAGELALDLEAALGRVQGQIPAPAEQPQPSSQGFRNAETAQETDIGTAAGADGTGDAEPAELPVRRLPARAVAIAAAVMLLGVTAATFILRASDPRGDNGTGEAASGARSEQTDLGTTDPAEGLAAAPTGSTREGSASDPEPPPGGEGSGATERAEGAARQPTSVEGVAAAAAPEERHSGRTGGAAPGPSRQPASNDPSEPSEGDGASEGGGSPSEEAAPNATGTDEREPPPALAEENRARATELSRLATKALVQGQLPEAIRLYREATLAFPRHAPAWRGLGLANERLDRRPEALRAYRRYLKLAPGSPDASSVRERVSALEGS